MTRRLLVEADGGSRGNPGPAGYGALVRDAETGEVLAEVAAGIGIATNNVAEYRGLIAGLTAAAALDPESVEVRMDSKLVIEQMAGRWQVKHPDMRELRKQAAEVARTLPRLTFRHVPRAKNAHADRLANEAMDAAARGLEWQPRPPSATSQSARPKATTGAPNRLVGWMDAPAPPTTTVLARHGQTEMSVDRRFSGSSDPELTETGRRQAAALAARVASMPVAAVVSSPLRRARGTAEVAAAALGAEVVVDDGWRETDFGEWEGSTFAEVRERWPAELEAWLADTSVSPPGGESFADTHRRVRQARDRLLTSYGGRTVLVVSHVSPIKIITRMALDAPPSALYRLHLDLACLSVVDWYDEGPAVLRLFNDTGHLGDAHQPGA